MTTILTVSALISGILAIFLFLHASQRRRPFARERLPFKPQSLQRAATLAVATSFMFWIAAVKLERAIFAGLFFLSCTGGVLLLIHALASASARRKTRQNPPRRP